MSSGRSRKTPQLNYNHLHYFHVAAVEGSVGGAAQSLGVTQPTISEQLRTLERALGVVLFQRQSSGLKLTEAGRLTFKHTSVMFSAGARLAAELDHGSLRAPDMLQAGVCISVARLTTASLLTSLLGIKRCVPSVRIAEHVELLRELRNGSLDLVLTDNEPPASELRGLAVKQLQRTQLSVVTPRPLNPTGDWQGMHLLQYRVGSPFRWDVDAYLVARALRPQVVAEADDPWMLLDAVTSNEHVAVIPHLLAQHAITSGRLREIERIDSQHVGLYALYRPSVEVSRAAVERLVAHYFSQPK